MQELRAALLGISAYQNVMEEPLMGAVRALLDALCAGEGEAAIACYAKMFYRLGQEGHRGLGTWLLDVLRYGDAPYARAAERGCDDPALAGAAQRDVETFARLAEMDCDRLIGAMGGLLDEALAPTLAGLPRWQAGADFSFDGLSAFYRERGTGLYARYRAFLWADATLIPVPNPDCPAEEEMLGYTLQRDQVIANTRSLLDGNRVNDVLLYGDSGTGKSATVKTLLSRSGFDNLRLVEIQKEGVRSLPTLIRALGERRQKFVLFLDDLAFDQDDTMYSVMKTILEGGLEARPQNVAIYATSNRRLLVRQTFSDRAGDEVDAQETMQEKTALSDRFGLRIPYLALSKAEFLDLAQELARRAGVDMGAEALRREAVVWDMHVPGRTPRTAKQFVAGLMAKA